MRPQVKKENYRSQEANKKKYDMKNPVFFEPFDPGRLYKRFRSEVPMKTVTAYRGRENKEQ
jgi:hypothetical protein